MIPRDGLVAEYLLAGDANDTSGCGRHGVAHYARPAVDRFGTPGGAMAFNGAGCVEVSPPPVLSGGAFSVSAWVRFKRRRMAGWTNCVLAQDNGEDTDQSQRIFQVSLDNGRIVWHRMMQSHDPIFGRRVRAGEWYHVVGVAAKGEHRLYVDGELCDSVPGPVVTHAVQPLHIGRKGTDEACFFLRGAIEDVRLYDRALSPGEVDDLFREGGFSKAPRRAEVDIAGRWGREGVVFLDVTHDGAGRVTGQVMAGNPSNMADIVDGTYDQRTGRFLFTGLARHPDSGAPVDYRIDGWVDGDDVVATAHFVARDGTLDHHGHHFLSRRGARARLWRDSHLRAQLLPMAFGVRRWLRSRTRPTKERSARTFGERGETTASFTIRDATEADIPELSRVHVTAWNATYNTTRGPTVAIREWQWRQKFANPDGSWFALVVVDRQGKIVGFTRGIRRKDGTGDFNKLYLLTEYQRFGLGRLLVGHLVRRFLAMGVTSMTGFVDPGNPSCAFFERIGGRHGHDHLGHVDYGMYRWEDLEAVARACPIEPA